MKNIIKALQETEYKPRAKWWGFVKDDKRYLCRYNHIFFVCDNNNILYSNYETITDKRGVEFAIKYFNEKKMKKERFVEIKEEAIKRLK
jgi:hypothetical protein